MSSTLLRHQLSSLRGLKKPKKGASSKGGEGEKSRTRVRKREEEGDRACWTTEVLDAVRDEERERDHSKKNLAFFRGRAAAGEGTAAQKKKRKKKSVNMARKVLKMAEKKRAQKKKRVATAGK